MALCPFHRVISVDKEIIGPVHFFSLLGCEKWPYSSQELQFALPDTTRLILGYFTSKLKIFITDISKFIFMQNNHTFKLIFSLNL